jgi:signal transduction histidine kinase
VTIWSPRVSGTILLLAFSMLHAAHVRRGAWVQNDVADGLPSAIVTGVREDELGRIQAMTAASVSVFQPDADRDPPRTMIQPLPAGEQAVREGASVKLRFSGRDKWNLTTPDRLRFSYRLDEREWSSFQEAAEVTFVDLPVGQHYFQARAMDRNANVDPKPARLEFAVVLPWYRETRLVLILSLALAVALFFAGLAFNRHRKLRLSYADVEQKIAERTRELELANRELLHSQKMNALGTLAAGIAHDFNNILSIVKGSSQIIEDNLDNPTKIRTRLDRIKTVVQQGAGIVQAMLGFSRNSEESPEPCDLNVVVDNTVTLLGDRFLREVEVSFHRAVDLPSVPLAKDFIQQILLNFIKLELLRHS